MKIVVIGGSGLIGKKLVSLLQDRGHEVVSASPRSGVNALTGEGLDAALAGATAVVDVSNSPSFADDAVLEFFTVSTRNLLAAEKTAGVKHHVALSVVGAERMPDSGYMRAKVAQETLIAAAGIPYTILRATQFFEFVNAIGESCFDGSVARLPTALLQPVAADDVALTLAEVTLQSPANGMVELAGPQALPMAEFVRQSFAAHDDARPVVADANARYFGAQVDDRSLTPGAKPKLGAMAFQVWLEQSLAKA